MPDDVVRHVLVVDDKLENRRKYADLVLYGFGEHSESLTPPAAIYPMVAVAGDAESAITILCTARERGQPFDVLVTDLFMQPLDGLELLSKLLECGFSSQTLDVVLVSREEDALQRGAEIDEARQRWAGATEKRLAVVLRSHPDPDSEPDLQTNTRHEDEFLEAVWRGVWERLETTYPRGVRNIASTAAAPWQDRFITRDANLIADVHRILKTGRASDIAIVITGPSGTGKELLAQLIHDESQRSGGPFVPVNCSAIPEALIESELFGHEKGAFTGATSRRVGLIERAKGGTLFLDEIGEMSEYIQVKLLRALNDKRIEPVGGKRPIAVDFRLLSATNRDLDDARARGTFRDDIYYRVKGDQIHLPSLAQRTIDIPPLLEHFWRLEYDGGAARIEPWDQAALMLLSDKAWNGNGREIRNFVLRLKGLVPIGQRVTTAEVGGSTLTDYVEGLNTLRGTTSRTYHLWFYPKLTHVLKDSAVRTKTQAGQYIFEAMIEQHRRHFADDLAEARAKIEGAWSEHLKACRVCRDLWSGRWG
jgi:DNA-binding NtrC family response regulator